VLVILVAFVIATLAFSDLPNQIRNSFHEGRSGSILLQAKDQEENSQLYLIGKYQNSDLTELYETDVADLTAHLTGINPVINLNSRKSYPTTNIFDLPLVNLQIVVPISDHSILKTLPFIGGNKPITIKSDAYPEDIITKLTTIQTGVNPSVHGIVGRNWAKESEEVINAYMGSAAQPRVSNFATIWSSTFGGSSLVFSASSDPQMAAALSVHDSLAEAHPYWNNNGFYFNGQTTKNMYETQTGKFSLTSLDIKTAFENFNKNPFFNLPLGAQGNYIKSTNVFQVTLDKQTATYTLSTKEDYNFFAELLIAINLPQFLNTEYARRLVNDNIPDLLSLGFASVEQIKNLYGAESAEYRIALHILDSVLTKMYGEISARYGRRIFASVLFLQSTSAVIAPDVLTVVKSHIINVPFEQLLPYIYLKEEDKQRSVQICEDVKDSANKFNVFCLPSTAEHINLLRYIETFNLENTSTNSTNNTIITPAQVAIFQITLWFSIALGLVVIAAVYAIMIMDVGKDSIIYRTGPQLHDVK